MKSARFISVLLWLCAVALGGWLLRDLPISQIIATLEQVSSGEYFLWISINCAILFLACYRWKILAQLVQCKLNMWRLFLVRQAGQTISFITPGPQFGGEPVQVYWLCSRFGLSLHRAVLALGLDRLYELWVNFIVLLSGLLIVLFFLPWAAQSFTIGPTSVATFIIALLLLAYLGFRYRAKLFATLERRLVSSTVKNTDQELQQANDSVSLPPAYGQYGVALCISVIVWVGIFFELEFVLHILNIKISHLEVLALLCAIRLAMLLPLPGGIGSIEAAILLTFQALSLEQSLAFELIALCRLRDVCLLVLGFWTLRQVQRQSVQNS